MEGESSCFFNIKNDVNTIEIIVIVKHHIFVVYFLSIQHDWAEYNN